MFLKGKTNQPPPDSEEAVVAQLYRDRYSAGLKFGAMMVLLAMAGVGIVFALEGIQKFVVAVMGVGV
jgi:hypothetical protein